MLPIKLRVSLAMLVSYGVLAGGGFCAFTVLGFYLACSTSALLYS
jgi:hypothetical protein